MKRFLCLILTFIMFICAMKYWQYDLGVIRISAVDIATITFDMIAIIFFLSNLEHYKAPEKESRTFILFNISILYLAVLSFCLIDFNSEMALDQYIKGLIWLGAQTLFIILFILVLLTLPPEKIQNLVRIYIFAVASSAVWSFAELYLAVNGIDLNQETFGVISTYNKSKEVSFLFEWSDFFRANGFAGTNSQGSYVLSAIPIILLWKPFKRDWQNIFALIVCIIGMLATMSKNALLGLFTSFLLIFFCQPTLLIKQVRWIILSLIPLALIIASYWDIAVILFDSRFGSIFESVSNIGAGRKEIYIPTLNAIMEHPYGFGLGQFYVHITSKDTIDLTTMMNLTDWSEAETRMAFANIHSNWLNWLFEYGLVGIVLFIYYYAWVVVSILRKGTIHAIAAASSIIGLIVTSFFNNTLDQFNIQLFIVLMFMFVFYGDTDATISVDDLLASKRL
jgi:O-antigen ligase